MAAFAQGALVEQVEQIVTAGGTTVLSSTNKTWIEFTGTQNQTVQLPDATTLVGGRSFRLKNSSTTGLLTVYNDGSTYLGSVLPGTERTFFISDVSTSDGSWVVSVPSDTATPLKIGQAPQSSPDTKLYIFSNQIASYDRTTKSTPPIDDTINRYPDPSSAYSTLDLSTGAVLVTDSIRLNGSTSYTLPATTIGEYRRVAFTYVSTGNYVDSNWSAAAATQATLDNPGLVFSAIDGMPLDYVDLIAVTATTYKTAGSSGTVIENIGITSFSTGAGVGSGGDNSFKLQTLTGSTLTIKGGFVHLSDGRQIGTYSGSGTTESSYGKDITLALPTLLASPSNTVAYYLYLALDALGSSSVLTDSKRSVYAVASTDTSKFLLSTTVPEQINRGQYRPLGFISPVSNGTWVGSTFKSWSQKLHDNSPLAISPVIYSEDNHSLGVVGSSGQLTTFAALTNTDSTVFPVAANAHVWNLNGNANDTNGTPINLSEVSGAGDAGVAMTYRRIGFYGRESLPDLTGLNSFRSTSATLNPSNVQNFAVGTYCLFNSSNTAQTIISNYDGTSVGWSVDIYSAASTNIRVIADSTVVISVPIPAWALGTWHSVGVTYLTGGNAWTLYLDGQKAGSGSASFTANGTFRLGAQGAAGSASNFMTGSLQDPFFTTSGLNDTQLLNAYSKRFNGIQIAAGHALTSDSFPVQSLTNKISYWNLNSTSTNTDGSGNGKTLSNGTQPTFSGLDLWGRTSPGCAVFGGSQSLAPTTLTDSFFNPSALEPFIFGGWFAAANWKPSAGMALIGNYNGGGTLIYVTTLGNIRFYVGGATYVEATTSLVNGSWHFLTLSYANGQWRGYIDGSLVLPTITNTWTPLITPAFRVGAQGTGLEFFTGRAEECFFARNCSIQDVDVRKLYSARLDLTALPTPANQLWSGSLVSEDGLLLSDFSGQSFVADKSPAGKVWVDFGNISTNDSAARVNLRCADLGLNAAVVPNVPPFDKTYTSAPTFPIPHGLATDIPLLEIMAKDLSGDWYTIPSDPYIKADSTNIKGTIASLFPGYAAVRIKGVVGNSATGVQLATATRDGMLGAQQFEAFTSVITSAYAAIRGDKVITDSSGGAFSVTLPASPAVGDKVEFYDGAGSWSTFNITILRNGSNIEGLAADYTLNVSGKNAMAVYISSAQGWRIFS